MKESVTIYLADDHQIVIDGLSLLLKNEPRMVICGYSTSGVRAFEDIKSIRPDIALLDLRMPDRDGLSIIRGLKSQLSSRFIILSMHNERRFINDAINYGADGYLLKHAGKSEMLKAIQIVLAGGKYFPERIEKDKEGEKTFLTPRELDILKLVINECTSQEIAEKLLLSQYTVDTHRKNIIRKTGVKNLAGLVKYAMDYNIAFLE